MRFFTMAAMQCPSCSAEISDPEAAFCSRCGASLATAGGDVTEKLDPVSPRASQTREQSPPAGEAEAQEAEARPGDDASAPTDETVERSARKRAADDPAAMMADMATSMRHAIVTGGWPQATAAAALGFAASAAAGAALVVIAKLAEPNFGSGRSPVWVVMWIVILGLMSLGVPIHQGLSSFTVLPMGLLIGIGAVMMWAARNNVARAATVSARERAIEGAKISVPFALICLFAAVIFRVREGVDVGAHPGLALVLGAFWGLVFGALGGLWAGASLRTVAGASLASAQKRYAPARAGLSGAGTMLMTSTVLCSAAVLVFVIISLANGDLSLDATEALALVLALIAFAPNLIAGTLGFSLGAPVAFLASTFGTAFTRRISLIGWDGDSAVWYAYFLLLVPLIACLFGGFACYRRAADRSKVFEILGIAAAAFAVVASVLVFLGGPRIDRFGPEGVLAMSADSAATLILGFAWAAIAGYAGWKLAESQDPGARATTGPESPAEAKPG